MSVRIANVEHDHRVDHRPLHAAADLHLLLDLDRDPVEDGVEDSGGLASLDHRDVEAVEGVRMARHRLREEHSALDVRAHLADDGGERLVVGLLLEDDERRDDAQAGVDHRRELAREDLERARLDALLLLLAAPAAPTSESETGRRPFWRRSSRAEFRSGAVICPADSAPSALIAL